MNLSLNTQNRNERVMKFFKGVKEFSVYFIVRHIAQGHALPEEKLRIIEIINKMRAEKIIFKRIADHLEGLGIPTLSGRGSWRPRILSVLL